MEIPGVEVRDRFFVLTDDHLDTCSSQMLHTCSGYALIRIGSPNHHAGDAGVDDRVRTRSRASGVAAWLEGHVHGRLRGRIARRFERHDLGMREPWSFMSALADHNAGRIHHDGPDPRIGVGAESPCEASRTLHRLFGHAITPLRT
jgi:hypothetical protein